jgi:hypothetical protein
MSIYSTPAQLNAIARILKRYDRLPFSKGAISGAIMEEVLAHVRHGERLNTYDFVDVVDRKRGLGWQVKSTKAKSPVTWKRAKIPNQRALIAKSWNSAKGRQALGNAIIDFCNDHVKASLDRYGLSKIGYARLVVDTDGKAVYRERVLCTSSKPAIFNPTDFTWTWSKQRKTTKKEQLSALHGFHKASKTEWWAWHGLSENQLHFKGENSWWPKRKTMHCSTFQLPLEAERLTIAGFLALLAKR